MGGTSNRSGTCTGERAWFSPRPWRRPARGSTAHQGRSPSVRRSTPATLGPSVPVRSLRSGPRFRWVARTRSGRSSYATRTTSRCASHVAAWRWWTPSDGKERRAYAARDRREGRRSLQHQRVLWLFDERPHAGDGPREGWHLQPLFEQRGAGMRGLWLLGGSYAREVRGGAGEP